MKGAVTWFSLLCLSLITWTWMHSGYTSYHTVHPALQTATGLSAGDAKHVARSLLRRGAGAGPPVGSMRLCQGDRMQRVLQSSSQEPLGVFNNSTVPNAEKSGSVLAWGDLSKVGPTPPEVMNGNVIKIAAGTYLAMALLDTREVVVWSVTETGVTEVPASIQGVVADIAAGASHAVALLLNGTVVAWGYNGFGQLDVPAMLSPGTGTATATSIAAGYWHTLALLSNGSVVAWGRNHMHQCDVPDTAKAKVISIAANGLDSFAVLSDGSFTEWGFSVDWFRLTNNTVSIATGTDQCLRLLRNGSIAVVAVTDLWGDWLGASIPVAVNSHVVAVSASENVSMVLRDTGEVVAWGDAPPGSQPISPVPKAARSNVAAIAAGAGYAVALVQGYVPSTSSAKQGAPGSLTVWGDTTHVGPAPKNATAGVFKVAAGDELALALLTTGEVVAWTVNNTWGQMDVPPSIQGQVVDIAAGSSHALALLADGSVAAWGRGDYTQTSVPSALQPGGTSQAIRVAAGSRHSIALLANGSVAAWGANDMGQTDFPHDVHANVKSISAFDATSLAVLSDGTLVQWGVVSPQPDVGNVGFASAAAGTDQVVALLRNGTVVSWPKGVNFPQTGAAGLQVLPQYPDILAQVLAVPDTARSNVIAVAASENISMALLDTGRVVSWGWVPPTAAASALEVPLSAHANVVSIAAGRGFAMATTAAGNMSLHLGNTSLPPSNMSLPSGNMSVPPSPGDGSQAGNASMPSMPVGKPSDSQADIPVKAPTGGSATSSKGSQLGTGALVGLAVGAVALVSVASAGVIVLLRRRQRRQHPGKMQVFNVQPQANSLQTLNGTTIWKLLTSVLQSRETFMRSVAQDYSWIIGADQEGPMHSVEAGVNDTQLDKLQQGGPMPSVVELSRAELHDQVHLLADGLLGRGATALVFKCVWPSRFGPDSLLAIKVLKDGSDADVGAIQSFAYEAQLLAALRHPNVVRVYGYCLEPPTVCLILELLPVSLKQKLYGVPHSIPDCKPTLTSNTIPTGSTVAVFIPGDTQSTAPSNTGNYSLQMGVSMSTTHSEGDSHQVSQLTAGDTHASSSTDAAEVVQVLPQPAKEAPVPVMSLLEIVRTSTDIAAGLAYLHSQEEPVIPESEEAGLIAQPSSNSVKDKRIVHRDLKPANILLNSEAAAKITDFGLARDHDHTTVGAVNMGAGTLPYMAPEQLAAARAGRAGVSATNRVDVYSLGMMMWEMLAGEAPWKGKSEDMIFAVVINHRRPPLPGQQPVPDGGDLVSVQEPLQRHVPGLHDHPLLPDLNHIIQQCWQQRDRKRPTAAAVHGMLTQLFSKLQVEIQHNNTRA